MTNDYDLDKEKATTTILQSKITIEQKLQLNIIP